MTLLCLIGDICRSNRFPILISLSWNFVICSLVKRKLVAFVRDGLWYRERVVLKVLVVRLVLWICGSMCNFYMLSLYRSPSGDEILFDYMTDFNATIQSIDQKPVCLFIGDMNGHHQDWLGSTWSGRRGFTAFDLFHRVVMWPVGCWSSRQAGSTLDLPYTDMPDLFRVFVVAAIGGTDRFRM